MSNEALMKMPTMNLVQAKNVQGSQLEWCAKQPPTKLSFLGTSFEQTAKALEATFGRFPIQIEKFSHEHILVGMANAAGDGAAPYDALLDAVRKYGEIEVRLA